MDACEVCGLGYVEGEADHIEAICLSSLRRQLACLTRGVKTFLDGGTLADLRLESQLAQRFESRRV